MAVELWWNDSDNWRPKNSERNFSSCHYAHHQSYMTWLRIEPVRRNEQLAS